MEQVTLAAHKGVLIKKAEMFETSIVSGLWRENSPPIEWHNVYDELPRYSGIYNIGSAAITEVGITIPTEAAARLEDLYYWQYASAPNLILDVDCHTFVDYTAFDKPLYMQSHGVRETATDTMYSNTPYRLVLEVEEDMWNLKHSFYTTDDPAMTLSVFGLRGVLAAMEINELCRTYETSSFVCAEDSRKEEHDPNITIFS